ncbi:hypothetical protein DITRI_Ditri07aG0087500 [Diplodiscus trichospermus]
MLKEKSRIKWLSEGDRNTEFFHKVLKRHRIKKTLTHLNIQGDIVDDIDKIGEYAIDYFSNLFSASQLEPTDFAIAADIIPNVVTEEENSFLLAIPNSEEVKHVVFAMDPSSTQGPDGFNGKFYQKC